MQNNSKKAFVTGGTRGIGLAIVERLQSDGYDVTTTYFNDEAGAKTIQTQKLVTAVKCDLTKPADVAHLIKTLRASQWDAIVNNAGVFIEDKPGQSQPDNSLNMWQLHFQAPLSIVQSLAPNLNSGASIVNIASTAAFDASFTSPGYSASKAALINLTQTQAALLGSRNIRVNAVSPGWILTGLTGRESDFWNELAPLSRAGRPQEVANVVAFLLSSDASYITGANIIVDGGFDAVSYMDKKESGL